MSKFKKYSWSFNLALIKSLHSISCNNEIKDINQVKHPFY